VSPFGAFWSASSPIVSTALKPQGLTVICELSRERDALTAATGCRHDVEVLRRTDLFLIHGSQRFGDASVGVEHGTKVGQLQELPDRVPRTREFQRVSGRLGPHVHQHQFTETRAIDVMDVPEVQQDVLLALIQQTGYGLSLEGASASALVKSFKPAK